MMLQTAISVYICFIEYLIPTYFCSDSHINQARRSFLKPFDKDESAQRSKIIVWDFSSHHYFYNLFTDDSKRKLVIARSIGSSRY